MALSKRGFLFIVALVIVIFVVGIAVASSGGSKPNTSTPKPCTATVTADIGLSSLYVFNQNTGRGITIVPANLPFAFNFTKGDTLSFNVTTLDGYTWNAWTFNDGTFDNHNPLTWKSDVSYSMNAKFLNKP